MSAIEEAREQARETLPGALARLVENRLGKSLAREADKDMIALRAAANAIVALLDATEPPKPAEDEREALTTLISATTYQAAWGECVRAADAILAAGYSKGPRPITDEMVEAAAREYHERGNGEGSFARTSGHVRTSLLFRMKCALRAAEEARR